MHVKLIVRVSIALLLLVNAALAAEITGNWTFDVTWGNGARGMPQFDLNQDGTSILETYTGGLGRAKVTGTIQGSKLP